MAYKFLKLIYKSAMKNRLYILGTLTLFSCLVILGLHYTSDSYRHVPNGFKRNFKKAIIESSSAIDLKFNSYYFAGISWNHIYLGNSTAPLLLTETDFTLSNLQKRIIENHTKRNIASGILSVAPPYFYLS